MKTPTRTTLMLAAAAAFVAFCSPTTADQLASAKTVTSVESRAVAQVPVGEWAGEHVSLTVTDAGAKIEFDCAHGSIDSPMTLDDTGSFSVKGTFVPERGGPEREDQPTTGKPAKYSGTLKDGTLTVTVELTETKSSVGVFTMKRGATARLTKCR